MTSHAWNRRRWSFAIVSIAIAALTITGCAGATSGDGDDERTRIYVLIPSLSNAAYIAQRDGAEAAAARVPDGFEVVVDAPSTGIGDATTLIPKLENAITQGADVLAVNAGAAQAELAPILDRAIKDGIKVILFDVDIPNLEGVTSFVNIDEANTSPAGGEFVREQLPDGGELFILSCVEGHPVTVARTEGFLAGLEGWAGKVVGTGDSQCDEAKARTIVENALTSHPNLDAFYSTTAQATDGGLKALEAAGKDLIWVSHDATAEHAQAILDGGILDADIINPFQDIAAKVVETAVEAAQGEDVDREILPKGGLVTKDTAADYLKHLKQYE